MPQASSFIAVSGYVYEITINHAEIKFFQHDIILFHISEVR